jgi:hypothetical protein
MTTDDLHPGVPPCTCPKCGTVFSVWKTLSLTTESKIACRQCGTRLRPDIRHRALLGGITGLTIGATGAAMSELLRTTFGLAARFGLYLLCSLLLFIIIMIVWKRYTYFTILDA